MTASTANITQEYGPFFGNDAVHGVSFSGKDVWFAGSNGLNRMDPDTGTVTQHVAVPAHAGTAFDGHFTAGEIGRRYGVRQNASAVMA